MSQERISSEEYRRRVGAPVAEKPQIRLKPMDSGPNKTEEAYGRILRSEFPNRDVIYEGISFRLASGLFTPDWTVWFSNVIVLVVEVKGGFIKRDSSLSKFKEARAKWHAIKFRIAQKRGHDFVIAE